MGLNIDFQHKFSVNGKEYDSLHQVPPEMREAIVKALSSRDGAGHPHGFVDTHAKIIFNDVEYEGPEAMPADIRQIYEGIMKAAGSGTLPTALNITQESIRAPRAPERVAGSGGGSMRLEAESSFSPRLLIFALFFAVLVALLYFILAR